MNFSLVVLDFLFIVFIMAISRLKKVYFFSNRAKFDTTYVHDRYLLEIISTALPCRNVPSNVRIIKEVTRFIPRLFRRRFCTSYFTVISLKDRFSSLVCRWNFFITKKWNLFHLKITSKIWIGNPSLHIFSFHHFLFYCILLRT